MPTTSSYNEPIRVFPIPGTGTEDVLVGDDGLVYTGTVEGVIHELDPATGDVRPVGRTQGRPLGLEWLPDGRILICDATLGLLALDRKTGDLESLCDSVGGRRMVFTNNAAVAKDGTIYFTDSSRQFPVSQWKAEFVEDTHSGRLIQRDPEGNVSVLVEGLRFSNGVALAADESYVAVAELNARTIHRRWLTGPKRNRLQPLVEDLPGYPDNIALGTDGLIWVAIVSPKDPLAEGVQQRAPLPVRKALRRLPDKLQPQARRIARAMAFDDDGRLVHDRQLASDEFHMVTGVREHHGTVWLGSLVEPKVASFQVG
ncbi:MAG TPA: SMP-30/gluconolactonase/LRE family protein [Nocardioidaceae bacterium]|nr:SMP-30/gluconolactonase/LRE family protein [Nocardioidaceae bacterium]